MRKDETQAILDAIHNKADEWFAKGTSKDKYCIDAGVIYGLRIAASIVKDYYREHKEEE